MDWITLTIEAIGVLILLFWVVVPIREFSDIFRRLKHKPSPTTLDVKEGRQ